MSQLANYRLKRHVILVQQKLDRLGPRQRRASQLRRHRLYNQLTDTTHQIRVSIRIRPESPCNYLGVHPRAMVCLILFKHTPNTRFRQAHVDIEVCGDIPWAVDLMLFFVANLALQMFDIRNP